MASIFNKWNEKFILRIRSRMFFTKYLEYRSSKAQGIRAFRENVLDLQRTDKIRVLQSRNVLARAFKGLTLNIENRRKKRERAFQVYFFSERWSNKKGWQLLK